MSQKQLTYAYIITVQANVVWRLHQELCNNLVTAKVGIRGGGGGRYEMRTEAEKDRLSYALLLLGVGVSNDNDNNLTQDKETSVAMYDHTKDKKVHEGYSWREELW